MGRENVLETLREDGVLLLTLNRPEKRNSFTEPMWHELTGALADARENDAVRVVVLTGAGNAFTAGVDLSAMAGAGSGDGSGFGRCMDELCAFDKPLLAAVNGVGVGFGITALLHCDGVFIAKGARLRAPFVTLGVVPEAAASYLLPAIIGHRRAMDVFFESDFISAERAVELGIADHLCEPDDVVSRTMARAGEIARKPLGSLRWTKRLVLAAREDAVAAARRREDGAFAVRVGSPENQEAIKAFFEKRDPDFQSVPPTDKN